MSGDMRRDRRDRRVREKEGVVWFDNEPEIVIEKCNCGQKSGVIRGCNTH